MEPPSLPPPIVWKLEQGQTIERSPEGAFALEYIDVTEKEFRFFYAFSSPYQGSPHIEIVSYLESNPKTTVRLATTIQPSGRPGSFVIGVIHAPLLDRVGQFVAIQITIPTKNTTWQLAPLRQLIKEPNPSNPPHYDLYLDQRELPAITFYGPVKEQQVAFLKDASSNYIFLRLDNSTVVQIITKAEYLAIAGTQNFS